MLFLVAGKKAILNLRLDPKVRDEFAIAAKLRGATMSGLLHQCIVRTIREEKAEMPQAFEIKRPRRKPHINGVPVPTAGTKNIKSHIGKTHTQEKRKAR